MSYERRASEQPKIDVTEMRRELLKIAPKFRSGRLTVIGRAFMDAIKDGETPEAARKYAMETEAGYVARYYEIFNGVGFADEEQNDQDHTS